MNEITLREVCVNLHVSRRAIQGYEKAGLIIPSSRNERGYLLYNYEAQIRIGQIKLFQDMGFSIKEIKMIIDAPRQNLRVALERQVKILQNEIVQKRELISIAQEFLKSL